MALPEAVGVTKAQPRPMRRARPTFESVIGRAPSAPDVPLADVSSHLESVIDALKLPLKLVAVESVLNAETIAHLLESVARAIYWPTEQEDENTTDYLPLSSPEQRATSARVMGAVVWEIQNAINHDFGHMLTPAERRVRDRYNAISEAFNRLGGGQLRRTKKDKTRRG